MIFYPTPTPVDKDHAPLRSNPGPATGESDVHIAFYQRKILFVNCILVLRTLDCSVYKLLNSYRAMQLLTAEHK